MNRQGIDAYIVPTSDPHLSEYLPEHWRCREWASGFTGSAGTLVITQDFAGLWTDGRYWSQAELELSGSGIVLMKGASGKNLPYVDWIAEYLQAGQTVGFDGRIAGLNSVRQIEHIMLEKDVQIRTDHDLVGEIWADRPDLPGAPIYEHALPYAPVPRSEKISRIREAMKSQGANWHFISILDDIAWLFNLRGSDIEFTPVFNSYALLGVSRVFLCIEESKVPAELRKELENEGIDVVSYDDIGNLLSSLQPSDKLLLDPRRITYGLWQLIPEEVSIVEAFNPTTLAKARKTQEEIGHIRAFMERDGAILCEFFAWLEKILEDKQAAPVTELTVGEKILELRRKQNEFVSPSFETIAGFNQNGALPHYRATPQSHAVIQGDGLLLIDTGGQYLGGTTDISRTVPVGRPSAEQKRDFTLVLKGMIALSSARFPRSMRSPMLDAIARAPLWAHGLDYGHGTGHGVGYFLSVHEGPQTISCHAPAEPYMAMEEGMVTSVEPAVYRKGRWGIRIENLVVNVASETTEFCDFLRFETLTLCPIDTRCIDTSLLQPEEINWLNAYHASVRERVLPHVTGDAKAWLMERTRPL